MYNLRAKLGVLQSKYLFVFNVDFNDLDVRIKLEDLKMNVIHNIESLNDDTTYLINSVFFDKKIKKEEIKVMGI